MINGNKDVFDKFDEINYIPVVGGDILSNAKKEKQVDGVNVTFITNTSLVDYNKFLINPFHDGDSFAKVFDEGNLRDDRLVFADSGGLQELRYNASMKTPEEIIKWQEKYCDVGFSLDCIPFKVNKDLRVDWTFDIVNFDNYANETKERIKRALAVRTEYKSFKFYGIIQGTNYDEYLRWKKIIDQDGIDGWCVKSPTNKPANMAETSVFVLKELNKPVHFLGTGNITRSIIPIYMKRYFKHKISFDSATANIGMTGRAYHLPIAFNFRDFFISDDTDSLYLIGKSMKKFNNINFCFCDACKFLNKIFKDPKYEKLLGATIMLHNLNYLQMHINYLSQIYDDKEKMVEYVKNVFKDRTRDDILECFEFIDDAVKHGVVEAKRKWRHIFQEQKKTTKQSTLF